MKSKEGDKNITAKNICPKCKQEICPECNICSCSPEWHGGCKCEQH
ncbi:MAG: hypothetical protein HQK91_10740 [Nitrospirae bacterium]|nr:hypothetical protein [Nitrospirota bacterium]